MFHPGISMFCYLVTFLFRRFFRVTTMSVNAVFECVRSIWACLSGKLRGSHIWEFEEDPPPSCSWQLLPETLLLCARKSQQRVWVLTILLINLPCPCCYVLAATSAIIVCGVMITPAIWSSQRLAVITNITWIYLTITPIILTVHAT